uniref:Uncharacterized protein n=1 Tax=Plectus sambesii TaxID=2011161 RepID=A0A914WL13_9BILA
MPANKSTVLNGDTTQVIIDYDIVIQRKPVYYLLTFILPCFMITTISIVGVFSPFNDVGDREEKVTMGLTTLLTMTLVLTLIADKMPKSSEGLSLLGTYVLLQIVIAAVTTLISVVIMYQSRSWAFGKPNYFGNGDGFDIFARAKSGRTAILKEIQFTFHHVIERLYEKCEEKNLRKSDEQRLVNSLFSDYNKNLRPVLETADVVNVILSPALFSIVGTDEALESITIVVWLNMVCFTWYMRWTDSFLQWNSTEFGGLNELLIPVSKIWYPDITVSNMIDVEMPISDEKNYAIINDKGAIHISVSQILTMQCSFHIIMFPFDIQNCTLEAASWMFYPDKVDVSYSNNIDMTAFHPNSEWDLISIFARKSMDFSEHHKVTWGSVYYDIIIQRKPIYYLLTFVLPCFMITTISIVGIFAPFNDLGDREEKVTMGLTTLLPMTVIFTFIADEMPKSSEGLPLLGIYISLQIGIASLTSLSAVMIMHLSRQWNFGKPVPAWISTVMQLKLQEHNSPLKEVKTADDFKEHYTQQERLVKKIFENYNKKVRPTADTADVINVTLNPALYSIVRTDEVAESITIVQYFRMTWKDAFLTWELNEFGGMEQLYIPISEIWYPDLTVVNTINIKEPISEERNFAFINYDGIVSAEINQILTMHCVFDITMFPFDIQNCTMAVISWGYNENRLNIFVTIPTDTYLYKNSSEWDLISMTARKAKDEYEFETAFVYVHYDILIQRKPIYYLLTFVLPSFIITTIGIIGIFAPFNDLGYREEKVPMGLTTLLTMIVVLTLIADKMPKSSVGLPLLGNALQLLNPSYRSN